MIDSATIEAAIEQVAERRAQLDRLEAWLREGAAILSDANAPAVQPPELPAPPAEDDEAEPPEPAPAAAPPVSRRSRRSREEVDNEVVRIVREKGPCKHGDVVHAGVPQGTASNALFRLVQEGRLRFREAPGPRGPVKLYEVDPDWGRTEQGQKAKAAREASQLEDSDRVQRVVDRRTVLKAILADEGDLTEMHLGMATGFDDEKIAEACAWLVEHQHASVDEQGRYSRGNRCPL